MGKLGSVLTVAKRILASRLLRYGFVVLAVVLGVYFVIDQWHDIHRALDRIGAGASVLALVSVLGALACTMLLWRALLTGLGSRLPLLSASRVLFVGQLGKYLPGSVWPVLAQMELAAEHRVPRHRTGAASVITMGISVLSGLLVGLVTMPFTGGGRQYWWAFLIAVPLVVCLYPPVLNALLRFGFKILRRAPLDRPLPGRALAAAMAWSLAAWACYGLQIWILIVRAGASPATAYPLAAGAFAFAFAVGFVMILAPAGAGFRDVLLAALLAPAVGPGAAAAIALVSRVATTLADVIVAAAAIVSYRLGSGGGAVPAGPGPAPETEPGQAARRVAP